MRCLACVAIACVASACWVTDVAEGDRLALLTARDLDAYGIHVPGPLRESYERFNGIECNGGPPSHAYIAVQVDVDRGAQSAGITMVSKRTIMVATLRAQGSIQN